MYKLISKIFLFFVEDLITFLAFMGSLFSMDGVDVLSRVACMALFSLMYSFYVLKTTRLRRALVTKLALVGSLSHFYVPFQVTTITEDFGRTYRHRQLLSPVRKK